MREKTESSRRDSEDSLEDPPFDLMSMIKSKKLISPDDDEEFLENGSLESRLGNVKGTL